MDYSHCLYTMKQIFIWACLLSLFLLTKSDEELARRSLLEFYSKLSNSASMLDSNSGWNSYSYPCENNWKGITCDLQSNVQKIALDGLNFAGIFDARSLCNSRALSSSLSVIDLTNNSLSWQNFQDIQDCFQLTQLFIGSNNFSGNLPDSISRLRNLQILDISRNQITGLFPDMSRMSGLSVFLAQENQFSGHMPSLNFSTLSELNISYNNLTGPVPVAAQRFNLSSFVHNPYMCGPPMPNGCTPIPVAAEVHHREKRGILDGQVLMYAGYVLIGLVIASILLVCVFRKSSKKGGKLSLGLGRGSEPARYIKADSSIVSKASFATEVSKTDYSSIASVDSGIISSSLVVLRAHDGMRFDDLLKAPAELLGRGNNGSVYKVEAEGRSLAVKRIKDFSTSSSLFRQRMRRLNQVKHQNVVPVVAYYSHKQEKLLIYEYQHNGSLFRLIHSPAGNELEWSSRLSYAATIADALAYMHEELQYDRIPHGNLKSSNILMNINMEPCISEYGVTLDQQVQSSSILSNRDLEAAQDDYRSGFRADTHAYGVILLELLTGRAVLAEGLELATWVVEVVKQEWTVEVFDKILLQDGVNEGTMINALQMAIRCVGEAPPSMKQVAMRLREIREEDERCRSMDVSHDTTATASFIRL